MNIKIKATGLTSGLRLDLKKNGFVWDLYQGETSLEKGIVFNDSTLGLDHYKVIVNDDTQSVRVVRFADLHRHSDNSLKDGIIKVSDMVKRTEYAGALTDHGNMYGFLEHYTAMKDAGKHPIIGIEAYQENAIGKLERNHLILLAKNETGYRNLLKLTSESFDHFYRAPHVTWEMLEKYHEGVVCASACLGGVIPQALLNRDRELAKSLVKRFRAIFGEDFYLEIQRHDIADEMIVNRGLISLSKEMNVPLIATTDSHYLNKEDAFAHEVTLCLQTGKRMEEPHMKFEGTGYHLFTSAEMEELFSDIPEVLDNTLRLAEKCSVDLKLGDVNLPNYQLPDGFETDFDYFKHLCEEGFKNRFRGRPELNDPKYKERFDYEMGVIKEMGFASYFIIVQDFINYARKVNVYIGPGRGSAAGSLLAFCMGITDMDPIRFNLLFERFLNPERVSWPDIDTDIEHVGRQKVIDYITKKYGTESVCRIVTFGTMAAKMVIKDVSRVMGYPPGWANALSKMVPDGPKMTLEKAVDMNPELRNRLASDKDASRVFDIAKTLEGTKRHASQHACFEANTLITTNAGLKKIVDVKVGDQVLTHNGRFKQVVDVVTTETNTIFTVDCYGAKSVKVTGNHPFLVRHQYSISQKNDGVKTKVRVLGNAIWKTVEDLEYDDYIAIPINHESKIPSISGLPVTEPAFWWVVGRYMGDGWTEIYHRKSISPNHTERRIIVCCAKKPLVVKAITDNLEKCGFAYRTEESRTTVKIFLNPSKVLYDYLQTFGRYAYEKHLTSEVLDLPVYLAEAFLQGYLSADGNYCKSTGIHSFKTVSEELSVGISLLINKVYHVAVGTSVKTAHADVIEGRTVYSKTQYTSSFIIEPRTRKKYFYEDDCLWVRVKDVKSCPVETMLMYNLTVLDDSSYQANGYAAHNCGLVISPGSVSNFLPTSMETDAETKEKSVTSQVVMTEVEALSLLKMDLLGLKNLTAIHEVITNIKKTRGIHIKYQDIPLNDRATYQMLAKGITGGVFQLESPGMTKVVMQMLSDVDALPDDRVEECFERLIAAVALYRPGPMDYIPDYVAGMQNPSYIQYDCPEEEKYLSSTFGVMVYQEQLMQVAQGLAGYSLGEADLLRKACGKKKKDVMAKEQNRFIYGNEDDFKQGKAKHLIPGCVGNGISEETAMHVWEKMEKFASYAFNRSHAACYAWIAYITAYMSCHWTPEFHCAMMNAFEDIGDKVKGYLALAARRNIQILPPDINKSLDKNTVEGESIRIGFHSLSHLNKFSRSIIKERKANGLFTDYQDFFERMSDVGDRPSKNIIESLIFSGSLDCFGLNKAQLMQFTKTLSDDYKANTVNRALGQMTLFDAANSKLTPPVVEEYNKHTLMDEEYKAVGFYLTDHPVDEFNRLMSGVPNFISISDLALSNMSRSVTTCGMIRDLRQLFTKKDEEMYVFTLEDRFNSVRCVMFPSRVEANRHALEHGAIVKAVGSYVIDEERGNQIIIEDLFSQAETKLMRMDSVTVSIRNREEQEKLLAFVRQNRGKVEVRIQAKGKIYRTSCGINLTPRVLDFLIRNFQTVKT